MELQMKRWNKSRISYVHYSYNDFEDFDCFAINLLEVLKEKQQYSLLLRINYNNDLYAMAGCQVGFKFDNGEDLIVFESLHESLKQRVINTLDNYNVYEITSIQVLYVLIEDMAELKLKNVNKIDFAKGFTNVKDTKDRFNVIPLTMDKNYFGKLIINDRSLYLNRINEQRSSLNQDLLTLDDGYSMHYYKDKFIILSKEDDGVIYRNVYYASSGILMNEIKDYVINNDLFTRKIGNASLTISKNSIVKLESEKKLYPIRSMVKSLKDEANPFIGSWDIETYNDINGCAKVYALGFAVLGKESKMYYLDENLTSEGIVLECINDMLVNEYNGYTFYTHNFGGYDSIFLIKILKEENKRLGYTYYDIKELCRDNKVLKLNIKIKKSLSDRKPSKIGARKDPGFIKITIVDSLNILNQSLSKLCKSFEVPVTKGHFPYSFVKKDTLHYVGDTPDYKYWENVSLEDYNELVKGDWNLKDECLKYLDKDLVSLVMVMYKFSDYINRKYYLQVTDSLTISRLALNIFFKDYLKDSKLPVINKNMFSDIKKAYYGGVTEVYKPYGTNLLHYDVNSLYPYAALNPMPGTHCTYIENLNSCVDLQNLYGFFYCKVKTNNQYLGLLPVHHKEGMIMPNGTWEGWYFSEELKYASDNGYVIDIIKGYNFNKVNDVFTDYVKDLYHIKSTTKDRVEKDIAKRLLNHLLGRFGLDIIKPVTKCVSSSELSLLFSTRKVLGKPVKVTDNDYWVTYHDKVDKDVCEEHGIDYIKVQGLTPNKDTEKLNEFRDVSLTTSAAVTAYARIYMSKIKQDILNKGGNIYYTDTDSIVTDIALDDSLIGDELGKFKLEYTIKQGYYISNKTYYVDLAEPLYDKNTKKYTYSVVKSKAVKNESLSLNSFEALYNNQNVKAVKRSAIKDYYEGSVVLVDESVQLRHDAYTKREKIYKRKKWVDTKPLVLSGNNDLGLDDSNKKLNRNSVKNKTSNSSTRKALKKRSNLATMLISLTQRVLDGLFIVGIIVLSSVLYLVFKEDFFEISNIYHNDMNIDSDLDRIVEYKYLDDYMEEPVETEIYEECSYIDKFIDSFTQKSSKFYDLFNYRYFNDVKQDVAIKYSDTSAGNLAKSVTTVERPQVLTSVLKHHLDIAYDDINSLRDNVSTFELLRIKKDVAIHDAVYLCKKALMGTPHSGGNSPIADYVNTLNNSSTNLSNYSPIVDKNFTHLPTSKAGGYTPFRESMSPNKGPSAFMKSQIIGLKSESPLIRASSDLIENHNIKSSDFTQRSSNYLRVSHAHSLSGDTIITGSNYTLNSPILDETFISKGSSVITDTSFMSKDKGLLIDTMSSVKNTVNTITDTTNIVRNNESYVTPRKYPIRTEESSSLIRRYGNIWPDKLNIESPSTIKRYGWVSPAGNSVLEDYSPLAKRHGHVFSDEFTLKKDYHLITEYNGVYKTFTPHVD